MSKLVQILVESRKIVTNLVWLAVAIVIVSIVGRDVYRRGSPHVEPHPGPSVTAPAPPPDWSAVDAEIVAGLKSAHAEAEKQANLKLDIWISSLMTKADNNFLEWYFGYWTQQVIGLKGIWYYGVNKIISDQPSLVEKITEDFQSEFSKRVLSPQISQMRIEDITREVLKIYVAELSTTLQQIPTRYNIPHPDWERHLDDIAVIISNVEGSREVPLSMKGVAASSVVAGQTVVTMFAPTIGKISAKLSAKLAGNAAAKIAAKTGAKVISKSGGAFSAPVIGVGIIIWDVWDHNHTKSVERPILRQALVDYFDEMKKSFLYQPESGIVSIIGTMEADIIKQLHK